MNANQVGTPFSRAEVEDERPDHAQGALGEVDDAGAPVDEDDPLPGQAVDGACPEPEDGELQDFVHEARGSRARFTQQTAGRLPGRGRRAGERCRSNSLLCMT